MHAVCVAYDAPFAILAHARERVDQVFRHAIGVAVTADTHVGPTPLRGAVEPIVHVVHCGLVGACVCVRERTRRHRRILIETCGIRSVRSVSSVSSVSSVRSV